MGRLAASLVLVSALSMPLSAQEPQRPPETNDLARHEPRLALSSAEPREPLRASTLHILDMSTFGPRRGPVKLGPFKMETPQLRGEFIRLSLPIGEYVSRVARGLSAAKRRSQEAAARRTVESELEAFRKRQPPH